MNFLSRLSDRLLDREYARAVARQLRSVRDEAARERRAYLMEQFEKGQANRANRQAADRMHLALLAKDAA